MQDLIADLNKKAALGRRCRRGTTLSNYNYNIANNKGVSFEETVKRRFERDIPLTQAAMVRFAQKMKAKAVKVIWFAAGKTDVVRMLKECHMWAEVIPAEISKADTDLGRYFGGAGNHKNF